MNADAAGFALHPRLAADTVALASLALCEVRLMDDARYPWLILVPRKAGVESLLHLTADAQAELLGEVRHCAQVLETEHAPTRLNIAMLGNLVPQLHVHVVARFDGDAAWPAPVWGVGQAQPYAHEALAQQRARYRRALAI